ncbi:hypothetical protein D3C85_1600120 [compost metagenome]
MQVVYLYRYDHIVQLSFELNHVIYKFYVYFQVHVQEHQVLGWQEARLILQRELSVQSYQYLYFAGLLKSNLTHYRLNPFVDCFPTNHQRNFRYLVL